MRLIDGWGTVLGRSWANRFNIINAVLQLAVVVLPFMGMLPDETRDVIPRWAFVWVPITLMAMAVLARIVEQPKLKERVVHKAQIKNLEKARAAKAAKRLAAAERLIAEEKAKKLLIEKMSEDTGGY